MGQGSRTLRRGRGARGRAAAWCSVLALAALGAPSAASAQGSPEERAFRVAERAWGFPGHCEAAGGVLIGRRPLPRGFVGYAGQPCAIFLNSSVSFSYAELCTVVTHELGHVHGYGHIVNRRDIMHPDYATGPWWGECLTPLQRRRTRVHVDFALNRSSYPYIGRPGVDAARARTRPADVAPGVRASEARSTQRFAPSG